VLYVQKIHQSYWFSRKNKDCVSIWRNDTREQYRSLTKRH